MRLSTGISGLDDVLEGGLLPGRLYVVSGPPGSGKTTFSAQFIAEGARQGEDTLYVTMHESQNELVTDMARFEFGFDEVASSKRFRFLNLTSERAREALTKYGTEGGLTNRLSALIDEGGFDRVVVDSTMLLDHFVDEPEREVTNFVTELKQTDASVLLISEMTDPSSYADEHYLAHGVLFFHNFLEPTGMTRGVQVIKMRGTAIDCDIRRLSFSTRGLSVHAQEKVKPQ
jgi:KaiC/GvpD/RAD55 family RecA-like ATPase